MAKRRLWFPFPWPQVRPFRPPLDNPTPDDDFARCGIGDQLQIDLHVSANRLGFFQVPPSGTKLRYPELVTLAKRVNALLHREGMPHLRKKRRETGFKDLELTVCVLPKGVYLTYVRPSRARRSTAGGTRRRPA